MKNPFLSVSDIDQTEYLTPRVSLNRAVIAKLPLCGVEDEIEGKPFKDIFSTPLIVRDIRATLKRYGLSTEGIPDSELPKLVDEGLRSENARKRQMAEQIARRFGRRLGLLLLMLRTGERENRLARDDWDDACWEFWKQLDAVILTGGLASGMLGRRFKEYIHSIFDSAGVRCYRIRLCDNASYLGVMGLAQRLMKDGEAGLVLDLGHTRFKRAAVRMADGEIGGFMPMTSLPSLYTGEHYTDEQERCTDAVNLHRHIVRTIVSSFKEASQNTQLSGTVLISVANYVRNGVLNTERGGFSKLSLLGGNYASLLSEELSSELHREISVRLVHDSTASAVYFDDEDNAVCITLGTAFGVGFPDTKL